MWSFCLHSLLGLLLGRGCMWLQGSGTAGNWAAQELARASHALDPPTVCRAVLCPPNPGAPVGHMRSSDERMCRTRGPGHWACTWFSWGSGSSLFLKNSFNWFWGRGMEKVRETSMWKKNWSASSCNPLLGRPYLGLSAQPGRVPWPEIKPATFWCMGWRPTSRATLARAYLVSSIRTK